jgi:hypothetical protein
MVDSRYYGGMGHDNMYSSHMQSSPHFSNPWTSHETHSTSAYPPLPKSDITRPSAMSMSYPQMAVSMPMSSGSSYSSLGYGGSDLLSGPQDIPRATYDNPYTTPSTSTSYTATASAYPQLGYAQSLHQHQQHQQQQRKGSDQYVAPIPNASVLLIIPLQKWSFARCKCQLRRARCVSRYASSEPLESSRSHPTKHLRCSWSTRFHRLVWLPINILHIIHFSIWTARVPVLRR